MNTNVLTVGTVDPISEELLWVPSEKHLIKTWGLGRSNRDHLRNGLTRLFHPL